MKKTLKLLGISTIALGGFLSSCGKDNTVNQNQTTMTSTVKKNVEAVTSIKLMDSILGNGVAYNLRMAKDVLTEENNDENNQETTPETTPIDPLEKEALQILPTLEVVLNNGSAITSSVEEGEFIYGEVTYTFKETITFKNEKLEDESYVLVYNKFDLDKDDEDDDHKEKTLKAKEDQVIEENNGDNNQEVTTPEENNGENNHETTTPEENNQNKPTEEVEKEELLKGLVLFSEDEHYNFYSKTELEIEDDEKELERKFHIEVNENTYIQVKEENEQEGNENEQEFKYTFVENGEVKLDYKISVELEDDGKDEVEFEMNDIEYKLVKLLDEEGNDLYQIKIENDKTDEETKMIFKKTTDEDGNVSFERVK